MPDDRKEIESSGFFDDIHVLRRLHVEEFSADEHVALMDTASDHRLMPPKSRAHLFAEMRSLINARPGGFVRKHVLTILHVARKKP